LNSELSHHYGSRVHILDDKCLNTVLTQLCLDTTKQPQINELVSRLYLSLIERVLDQEFPHKSIEVKTRMAAKHPEATLKTTVINKDQRAVCVNLARAGTLPSHICYTFLNYVLNPDLVRQDHITAARKTNENNQVIGTSLAGSKIGGDINNSVVIFPDPMGATGGTIVSALDHYKNSVEGMGYKFIAIHLIVTPEYLKRVLTAHKDLIIYTLRVDRGLSSAEILKTDLGKNWDQERGLDDTHYIVPGAGGVGELLNNSFV
jgi:uracil phosphoribosyltransferase